MVAGTTKFSPALFFFFFFGIHRLEACRWKEFYMYFKVDGVRKLKVPPPVDDVGCVKVEITYP